MSETKDRPEADPAIETTAIETLATEEAATDAADIEASVAVEGVDESEDEVTEAVSVDAAEAVPAETPPEEVVATAVLVVDEPEEPAEAAAGDSEPVIAEAPEPEAVLATEADELPDLADLEPLGEGDLPLLDDEIEHGIAEVFAALQAAAERGEISGEEEDEGEPLEALGDDETADGITFQLLGELDRLWHRAA